MAGAVTREGLERTRIAVPGLLVVVLASSLLLPDYDPPTGWRAINAATSGVALGTVVIGVVVHVMGFRGYVLAWTWDVVQSNIRRLLVEMVPADALSDATRAWLAGDQRLMQVFYHYVDKDPSLMNKRDAVYTNGAVVSSCADVLLGTTAHLVAGLADAHDRHFAWVLVFGTIFLLALAVVLPAARRKHLRLSNDQLAYIGVHYRRDVARQLLDLAGVAGGGAAPQ